MIKEYKPKMIIFDYGQTLIAEEAFDAMKGNREVLKCATRNPNQVTVEQVQKLATEIQQDISNSFVNPNRNYQELEIRNSEFDRYLYEYFELEFDRPHEELEKIFWDNASPGKPTRNVEKMLDFLQDSGIRTAIISNIMISSKLLTNRINELLPYHHFEFIMTSSEYIFRKPHHRIFDLALIKAKLDAKDVWFCGDNLYCDMEGASRMGMKAIWYPTYIDRDYQVTTEAEYTIIEDWEELISLLMECR